MLSNQLRVDTQDHTLALAAVQLSPTGGTEGLHCLLQEDLHICHRLPM
jgi:hypothetical protein